MPIWYSPRVWTADQLVTAAQMNEISESLRYLNARPRIVVRENSGTYVSTSGSWVAVAPSFTINIGTNGGGLMIRTIGAAGGSGQLNQYGHIGISLDGTVTQINQSNSGGIQYGLFFYETVWTPAAGLHTVSLVYRTSGGGSVTVDKNSGVGLLLSIWEL